MNSEDHPRACGEKSFAVVNGVQNSGSPPRMRGKDSLADFPAWAGQITPAHAGKRRPSGSMRTAYRDHPRACGEKDLSEAGADELGGSPPRMRGKADLLEALADGLGITPAYAGKSRLHTSVLPWRRDHPRICGEKERWQGIWNSGVGSPPRMRGKGNVSHYHEQEPRITPAYAGKRMDCLEY